MGASGWSYRVPFQPDINKALQELRQKVFEAGNYYKADDFMEMVIEQGIVDDDLRLRLEPEIEKLRSQPKPATIAELRELNAEAGTHSILDIDSISDQPDFGTVSPLSDEELTEIFETTQPSIELISSDESALQLYDLRERWQGVYIIAYKDGAPSEIFFCGTSGD